MLLDLLQQENIIKSDGKINNNAKKMLEKRKELQRELINRTSHISGEISDTFKERIYCVIHNITDTPLCPVCGNPTKFVHRKYQQFCSLRCANTSKEKIIKTKHTNQERYGGNAPMCSNEIKNKAVQTNRKRYGHDYHQQSHEGKKQRASTCIEKFGGRSPSVSKDVRQKIRRSMKATYGCMFNQQHISQDALTKLNDSCWLRSQHSDKKIPIYKIAESLGVSTFCVRSYMQKAGIIPQRFYTSEQQKEIGSFLTEIGVRYEENNRSIVHPYEIDIVIPTHKVAIEVNGIFWHGELQGKNRRYHIDKTNDCNKKGWQLIHITDYEWNFKEHIVKSRLAHKLNRSKHTVYARKCSIVKLDAKQRSNFFAMNHIQGDVPAAVAYGLVDENDYLQAVISLGACRFNKKFQWELLRYATKLDTSVVGGMSKLFAHFVKTHNPVSVVTYSDVRWNQGEGYSRLGFDFLHRTQPNYYYFKRNDTTKLFHRSSFQKHKLSKRLDYFDPSISEWENMVMNGYDRIWDCGNDVYGFVT